jgi:phage terminase small subunit
MENLTTKQQIFIQALLAGQGMTAASKAAGVVLRTGEKWIKLPHVKEAHRKAQEEIYQAGLNSLKMMLIDAIETLRKHLSSKDTPSSVQVKAAEIIISKALDIHTLKELEDRLDEMEHKK